MKPILYLLLSLMFFTACKKSDENNTTTGNTQPGVPPIAASPSVTAIITGADTIGSTITILGSNFDKVAANNIITFNKAQTTASQTSNDTAGYARTLKIIIPADATTGLITIKVGSQTVTLRDTFYIKRTHYIWKEMKPFPGGRRTNATSFVLNNKGYVATGVTVTNGVIDFQNGSDDLWLYNDDTDTWTKKANVPAPFGTSVDKGRWGAFSFVINNTAYLGNGTSLGGSGTIGDINQYDAVADKWTTEPARIPPADVGDCLGFSINNKGYIAVSSNSNLYTYDPVKAQLIEKMPTNGFPKYIFYATANNIVYTGNGLVIDSYTDPMINNFVIWSNPSTNIYPSGVGYDTFETFNASPPYPNGFIYNNCLYLSFKDVGNLCRFNFSSKMWENVTKQPVGIAYGATSFFINHKLYVIGGSSVDFLSSSTDKVWMINLDPYVR